MCHVSLNKLIKHLKLALKKHKIMLLGLTFDASLSTFQISKSQVQNKRCLTQNIVGPRMTHVALQIHHYLWDMTYGEVDINGSLELSTFFLLSGFCLALKYGK